MKDDEYIGDRFQELTQYSRNRISGEARPARRPAPYKEYPGAKTVSIAQEELPKGSLWKALRTRRSRRTFKDDPISVKALSNLVWAAQGPTSKAGKITLRTAPSAGALYPVETYLVLNRVTGIEAGVYHYNIQTTALELIKQGHHGSALAEAALGQGMCDRAAAVFCFTAIADRCKWKYAQRAYRYIYMDAGHIGANIYLAAEDLGLGCCAMGAFYDEELNKIIGVDGESEKAIYLCAVGPLKGEDK